MKRGSAICSKYCLHIYLDFCYTLFTDGLLDQSCFLEDMLLASLYHWVAKCYVSQIFLITRNFQWKIWHHQMPNSRTPVDRVALSVSSRQVLRLHLHFCIFLQLEFHIPRQKPDFLYHFQDVDIQLYIFFTCNFDLLFPLLELSLLIAIYYFT